MGVPRVAVIGSDHWHTPLYLDALATVAEVEVVEPGSDARPAISRSVDMAVVLGEHAAMPEVACALIDAGVPFILEKPGAADLAGLERVQERACAAGVAIAVPFVHRDSAIERALAMAGQITSLTVGYLVGPPSRYPEAGSPWMLDPALAGGGVLANLGPHFIDLFRSLAGSDVAEVKAVTSSTAHGLAIEDHASVLLRASDGCVGTVEVGYSAPGYAGKRLARYSATGGSGLVWIEADGASTHVAVDGSVHRWSIDSDTDHLFADFVTRAVGSMDHGFDRVTGIDDLVAAMRIVRDAYRDAGDEKGSVPWAK